MTTNTNTTFTKKLKEYYENACKKSKEQANYYSVSSKGIIERSLDLKSDYVFCDIKHKDKEPKRNKIKEYKLQAFMIKRALKDENWFLSIITRSGGC